MVTYHFSLTFPRCSSLTITVTVFLFSQMPSFFIEFIVLSEDRMNTIMEFKMTDNIIKVLNWEVLWRQVRTVLNKLLHLATTQRFHAKIRVSLSSLLCVFRWHYIIGASTPSDHPATSWRLIQGCVRPCPHAAEIGSSTVTPTTDKAKKKKIKRKEQKEEDLRNRNKRRSS